MSNRIKILFVTLFVISSVCLAAYWQSTRLTWSVKGVDDTLEGKLLVHFLDVGQGDAILIQTPCGQDILIDGGADNTLLAGLSQHLSFFNRDIELMILTHPHSDHVAGLVEVLDRYEVDKVLTTGVEYGSPDYVAWLEKIADKDIPVEIVDSPRNILFSEVRLEVLFPDRSFNGQEVANVNDVSIVTRIVYLETEILLTGDYEEEETLLNKDFDLRSDIYKAGHHGSNNANDYEFVQAVDPDYVIISCGQDNSFGHPHYRAMKNFESVGAQILRTDQDGSVTFISDGQHLSVKP